MASGRIKKNKAQLCLKLGLSSAKAKLDEAKARLKRGLRTRRYELTMQGYSLIVQYLCIVDGRQQFPPCVQADSTYSSTILVRAFIAQI